MKRIIACALAAGLLASACVKFDHPTAWERLGGGECVDAYFAFRADDPPPWCPHYYHTVLKQWIRTDPDTGVEIRTVACVCSGHMAGYHR